MLSAIINIINMFKSGINSGHYYRVFNQTIKKAFGEYYMLHYPLYKNDGNDLFQCQKNLTDYCLGLLPCLTEKNILEVGCGNGIQAMYIYEKYAPASIIGIDLNEDNINIANMEKEKQNSQNIEFLISDAQELSPIKSNSMDVVINIESACHYPEKGKFLREIYRVLKPGGRFVIADILTKKYPGNRKNFWEKKMKFYHWSLDRYKLSIPKSGLNVETCKDITQDVLKGFKVCSSWIKNCRNIHLKSYMRIWGKIMLALNAYLLKKRRTYHIFAGMKPI